MIDKIQNTDPGHKTSDITPNNSEKLRDKPQDAELKKVVKDMEALFAYQLIKVMRETADSMSSDNKGLGNSTYMSLFDMEISKLFAERGLGLQGAMMRWLEHSQKITDNNREAEQKSHISRDNAVKDKGQEPFTPSAVKINRELPIR